MTEFGFDLDIQQPPLITVKGKNTLEVQRVRTALLTYQQQIDTQNNEFSQTITLLARLMSRRKNSFRRFIVFRYIQKMNSAALRLLVVDLKRDMDNFLGSLPDNLEILDDETDVPTRHNLEYLLIRIYSVYEIHERIRDCCLKCGEEIQKILYNCFFIDISSLLLAVVGKIHTLNLFLGNQAKDLYNILYKYKKHFPIHSKKMYLSSFKAQLPEKLETLSMDGDGNRNGRNKTKDEEHEKKATKKPNIVMGQPKQQTILPAVKMPFLTNQQKPIDMGYTIEREPSKKKTANKVPHVEQKLELSKLKKLQDIKKFIKLENNSRKTDFQSCITKNIPNHEWKGAQKILEKKTQGNPKMAIHFFTNFLKSKI